MRIAHEMSGEVTATTFPAIKPAFDAYVQGTGNAEEFDALMLARCRENPDMVWELLALIDQYERRGQLGHRDVGILKAALGHEAYGRPILGKEPAVQQLTTMAVADSTELTRGKDRGPIARLAFSRAGIGRDPTPSPQHSNLETRGLPQCGMVLRNRFVLEKVLGSGGMGTVFRALDRNRLDLPETERHVALKVLRDDLAMRPEALDRLKREFHQTQRLSHPGIVNVFDFDSHAGIHFITMELLRGESLSELMVRMLPERVEQNAAFVILREIGDALSHAHCRSIVHADLKPGNIMLTGNGELRVLDFGLAMPLVKEPWISNLGDTFQGMTRTYASCERLAGDSAEVRDDIFSYACIAYELLAGAHPFARMSASQARDQRRRPQRIPDLSRRQWRALQKGLAWERAERPDNVAALVADLVPEALPERLVPSQLHSRQSMQPGAGKRFPAGWTVAAIAALVLYAGWHSGGRTPSFEAASETLASAANGLELMTRHWAQEFNQWRSRTAPAILPASAPMPDEVEHYAATEASEGVPTDADAPVPSLLAVPEINAFVPSARIEFAQETYPVLESSAVARLIVRRRGSSERAASFRWRTVEGSATGDQDFAAFGTIEENFAPGQVEVAILVPIVRDSVREGVETFSVELVQMDGQARLGNVTRAAVVIDDEKETVAGE